MGDSLLARRGTTEQCDSVTPQQGEFLWDITAQLFRMGDGTTLGGIVIGPIPVNAKDKDLTTPPVSPANRDTYIVPSGATGTWSGKTGKLAFYYTTDGLWHFLTPRKGWTVLIDDESAFYTWNGSAWVATVTLLMPANSYFRFKTTGTTTYLQLYNADQNKYHTIFVQGGAGVETISLGAGEV